MKIFKTLGIPIPLLVLCTAFLASTTMEAAEAPANSCDKTPPAAATADAGEVTPLPLALGLRAYIDPKTGQLRQPTQEEIRSAAKVAEYEDGLNGSLAGLGVEYRRDGSKIMNLQGRFLHSMVVHRAPDGSLVADCVDTVSTPPATTVSAANAPAEK